MTPPALSPVAPAPAAATSQAPRVLRPAPEGEAAKQEMAFDVAFAFALAASAPAVPATPAVPAAPAVPDAPASPAVASGEAEPAKPAISAPPATPAIAAIPADRARGLIAIPAPSPAKPKSEFHGPAIEKPAPPETPGTGAPARPAAPAAPAVPAPSATPAPAAHSATPAAPALPATPAVPAQPANAAPAALAAAAAMRAAPGSAPEPPPTADPHAAANDAAREWSRPVRQGRRPTVGAMPAPPRSEGGIGGERSGVRGEAAERKSAGGAEPHDTDAGERAARGTQGRDRGEPHVAAEPARSATPADGFASAALRLRAEGDAALRAGDGSGKAGGSPALREHVESRPARASEFVTLSFTDGSESGGRVRLSMRGDSLRATILSSETALLDRLEPRLDALRRSLAEQGFDQPLVALRSIATSEGTQTAQEQGARRERGGEPRDRHANEQRERREDPSEGDGRRPPRDTRKGR